MTDKPFGELTDEEAATIEEDTHSGYQVARNILGSDFITPEEIAEVRELDFPYTKDQLALLASSLPEKEVLQWACDNGFMVVAGPPRRMSLVEIHELNPRLFYNQRDPWFSDKSWIQKFAWVDMVPLLTWLMLRKDHVPGSTFKTWSEQQGLLSDNERVPNAAEVVWGFTTYEEVRGICLVTNVDLRTSSVDLDNGHVLVIKDGERLYLQDRCWDKPRRHSLGVASVRKLPRPTLVGLVSKPKTL